MLLRFGQLTDIHVCDFSDLRKRDFLTKRATGYFNYMRHRRHEYDPEVVRQGVQRFIDEQVDFVVVSGDLSSLGLKSELLAARSLLEPLREAGIDVFVLPGNHDNYVKGCVSNFDDVFGDWRDGERLEAEHIYPYAIRRKGWSVVMLDSTMPLPPAMAYGRIGSEQLERTRNLMRAEKAAGNKLVVALHHPPNPAPHKKIDVTRNLKDAKAFRVLCDEEGAELVIHGHNHFHDLCRLERAEGPVCVALSSSTTTRDDHERKRGQIGLYEAGVDSIRIKHADWDQATRGFGAWLEDTTDHLRVIR